MSTVLFTIPLKADKFAEYQAFSKEINGSRKEEYADMLKRYGLKNTKVWYKKFGNQEYVMVLHDTEPDVMERFKSWNTSTHPFDIWFNQQCLACYDIEDVTNVPGQPEFIYAFNP